MAEKQQDIHTGMKMTEAGWIPGDWVCKQIGTIGYTYNGITGKTKSDFGVGNARYITFLNILNNPQIDTKIFERVNITDKDGQNAVIKGDLFFNTSSETPEEVGICSTLTEEVQNVYLNSFCFGFRLTDKEMDGLYLSYYFRSHNGRALMTMLAQGATRYNLSKENFNKSYIGVPSTKNEQHRIAQVLSDMDMLIASLSRTIEKKRLMKQGAMQQLLTGKTRLKGFKGEWVEKELGDVCRIQRGAILKSSDYCYGSIPVIAGGKTPAGFHDVANREGRTITISASGANAGYVSFHNGKIFASDCSTISESKDYNIDFIYQFLLMNQLEIYRAQTGGAQPHIHPKDIAPMKIKIPNYVEQFAISEHLRTMDNEIESLEIELQKYKALKQGMMQKLLTGQIRLSYGKES